MIVPLCKTCRNVLDFPKCCTESLEDSIKIISHCRNYDEIEIPENGMSEIEKYKKALKEEMKKLGAEEYEIGLIRDAVIRNAMQRNRNPAEVAKAILS